MSRIAIVLCHPSSQLHGEFREAAIACAMAFSGIEVRLFRLWGGKNVIERDYFEGFVNARFMPADNPDAPEHQHTSKALTDEIGSWNPDVIVFKGIGYDVVDDVIERRGQRSKYAFILGGGSVAPCLKVASLVFAESDKQRYQVLDYTHGSIPCEILAKYVNWNHIRKTEETNGGLDNLSKTFDIVNVGNFDKIKNQIALSPLFDRYKIGFVGHGLGGQELDEVKTAAAGRSNVVFLGSLNNAETLSVIIGSRLMVHTSNFEGLPRVLAESLSCGVPFLGYAHAIQAEFPQESGVLLTTSDALLPTAASILDDTRRLDILSRSARAYALQTFSWQSLSKAVEGVAKLTS
ncbi:MAG: glycosyltransferase [Methylococcaceae bacterium]|nr:glycosyltransferase [Methylococcaceae bacterium]